MKILAFDTSTSACSAALYVGDDPSEGKTFSRHEIAPKQHTSIILPMMQSLLNSAGITLASLDAIAFGCGPGSFTGIRIAASLAQGLAYANSLPVIPVSSLAANAQSAFLEHGWKQLITAVDARMNQVYWCAYQIDAGLAVPVFAEELAAPDAVHAVPAGEWFAIGDGWGMYPGQLTAAIGFEPKQIDAERVPGAEAVLCLAKERFSRGDWVDAANALPVYLR